MTFLFLGLISFVLHPIKFIKYMFGSWHANQHANDSQPYLIKFHSELTEEDIKRIRERFLAAQKTGQARSFYER